MMSRTRSTALLLSSALLSATALVPAGALTVENSLPTSSNGVDRPSSDEAELVRERLSELPTAPGELMNPMVERVAGDDRYATAAELSMFWRDYVWAEFEGEPFPFDKVALVASGENFPDALSGGALAGFYLGPVLLTRKDSVPAATAAALEDLNPDAIVVLGGTAAISTDVETDLAGFVSDASQVTRIAGSNRYATSAAVATQIGPSWRAYVATGENWPDGLAGGAAAAWDWGPLLITQPDDVPDVVMETLENVTQPAEIVLLGGTSSVSDAVLQELDAVAGVTRVAGPDRYATAADLATWLETMGAATVTTGLNWPDALAGSAYAGLTGAPVLLVRTTSIPDVTRQAVIDISALWITVLGGPMAVAESVLDELRAMELEVPMP